mgnify:CR=1 FL=1
MLTMDKEVKRAYLHAGRIVRDALKLAVDKVHVGMPITELCDIIEGYILKRASLAFPCNISINEVAAHDTAEINDQRTIPQLSLIHI